MNRANHEDADIATLMGAPLAEQAAIISGLGMPTAGLLILLSPCEQRCHFCAQPAVTHPPPSAWTPKARINTLLSANAELKLDRLCIGGTEPTTHPDFEHALSQAKRFGFTHIELMTSATKLAIPGVAERWWSHGVRAIAAPIYSANPAVHDAITGGPHHAKLVRGLDAAKRVGMQIQLHALALSSNLSTLEDLGKQCRDRWDSHLSVAPARPKQGVWNFEAEAPSLDAVAAALSQASPDAITLTGWPDCLLPHLGRDAAQIIRLYFLGQTRAYGAACLNCQVRPSCPGVVQALLARDGDAHLKAQ